MPREMTWLGAIAVWIRALFGMLTRGVTVSEKAIDMVDRSITHARKRQAIELGARAADYAAQIRDASAVALLKREAEVQAWVSGSPERAEALKRAREEVSRAMEEELSSLAEL
jgi:hypothetical protein